MKHLLFTCLLAGCIYTVTGQTCRYLDQVFTDVNTTPNIRYGVNATILTLFDPTIQQAVPQPLILDLYEPADDNLSERPLIIYFHSGNFLPFPQNQSPVGTRRDSSVVEMCRRLARSGYVVASADYRLGWNPLDPNPVNLTVGLINAAYRGVQDANTCIRFFKKSYVEDGNPYGIDTTKIVLFGDDTGGYLSLNAAALDRYSKIPETPKFCIPISPTECAPMVIEQLSGDVEAKTFGVNTPPIPGLPIPPGDTLCYANHVEYSSAFDVAVSMGGAVGDTSWIDPGQPAMITVHTPYDQTSPYNCGTVYIRRGTDLIPVIHVCGSMAVANAANGHGNNHDVYPEEYCDLFQAEVTGVALARSGGVEAILTIYGDTISDGSPWEFWNCTPPDVNVNCESGLDQNPNMSREKAYAYMDTILAYVWPRLYDALKLADDRLVLEDPWSIAYYPNPATDQILFETPDEFPMVGIRVTDLHGRVIHHSRQQGDSRYVLDVYDLSPGMYLAQLHFEQGVAVRPFIRQ